MCPKDSATKPDLFAELVLQQSNEAIAITDTDGKTVWINRGFEAMTGFTLADMLRKRPSEVLKGAETGQEALDELAAAAETRRPAAVEALFYKKSREATWLDMHVSPIFDSDGSHVYNLSISRDVTARRQLDTQTREVMQNEEHRQHERRLLSQISEWLYSAKSLDELLMVVKRSIQTLIPEADGQLYIYSNSRDTLQLATSWGDTEAAEHIGAEDCWALRRGRAYSYGTKAIEFPCGHVHNENSPYFCLPIIAHGETIGLMHLCFSAFDTSIIDRQFLETFINQRWELALLCAEQISLAVANVQLRQELQDQSVRDPLTNLWNRRWFLEAAHKEINRAKASGKPVSLISLDVDHFKKFNDHHGHDAGDIVLREVGALMTSMFKDDWAPCRIGGEEFVVLCPGVSVDEAVSMADEYRRKICQIEVQYGGGILPRITTSGGVSAFPEDGQQVLDLMKAADEALYKAKADGRDRIVAARDLPPPSKD